jgi:peptidase M42 family hydrolase
MRILHSLPIDRQVLREHLSELLAIPSPTGMTDQAVAYVCQCLEGMGVSVELTRRGAIRATLRGRHEVAGRALVTHLDTLGAIVKGFRANGRPSVAPIGTWSPRFAEGARVTLHCDGDRKLRGTILPLKASGHVFGEEIDRQEISWDNLEVRLDERTSSAEETRALGVNVGDTISIDPQPDFASHGFINARHLDNKAGVAAVLAATKAVVESGVTLPIGCHLLFTISEEVGVGASHVLHGDVAEMVSIDNGTSSSDQYTSDYGVTIAMQDSSGPFDWHLTRRLIEICHSHGIEHSRDVFNHYRSDSAAAVEAGNDIRTALICFALDASHGYERTHIDSLESVARLVTLYVQSPPLFERDEAVIGPTGDLLKDQDMPSTGTS